MKTPLRALQFVLIILALGCDKETPRAIAPTTNAVAQSASAVLEPTVADAKTIEIKGEIFIVRNDGESVRLGGVEVFLVTRKTKEFYELMRKSSDSSIKQELEMSKLLSGFKGSARMDAERAKEASTRLQVLLLERYQEAKHFENKWFVKGATQSDASGNFSLRIAPTEELFVFARASRAVAGKTEYFVWLVPVPASGAEKLLLSNRNALPE